MMRQDVVPRGILLGRMLWRRGTSLCLERWKISLGSPTYEGERQGYIRVWISSSLELLGQLPLRCRGISRPI